MLDRWVGKTMVVFLFHRARHTDPVLPAVLFSTVWYSFRNIKLTPQWDNYLSVNPSSAYCWLACIRASAAGLKWIRRLIVCWLDKKRNSWINFVIFKSFILSLMFSLCMQNPKSGGLQTLKHTEGIPTLVLVHVHVHASHSKNDLNLL